MRFIARCSCVSTMCLAAFFTTSGARADTAVTADPNAPSSFSLGVQFTAGWRFTVNDHLLVTHLGLYDWHADGFEIDYPIIIWNSTGDVIAQAEVSAGMVNEYLNGFRYVSIESLSQVVLSPGETYTIGYWQSVLSATDRAVHFNGFHQMSPLIDQIGGGWNTSTAHAMPTMPHQPFLDFEQWFGPSFQFTLVPTPGTLALVVLAPICAARRRRR